MPRSVWAVILGAALAGQGVAQRPDSTATITGVVRDSARAVALPFSVVTVISETPQRQQFTSDSGRFQLDGVHAGSVTIRVRHLGFAPRQLRLTLAAGDRRQITVDLVPVAVTLPVVPVRANLPTACREDRLRCTWTEFRLRPHRLHRHRSKDRRPDRTQRGIKRKHFRRSICRCSTSRTWRAWSTTRTTPRCRSSSVTHRIGAAHCSSGLARNDDLDGPR